MGYLTIDDFISVEQCEKILELTACFRKKNTLAEIYRPFKERSLRYWVINGEQIEMHLPDVWALYTDVNQVVNETSAQTLCPLKNKLPTVNINIMKPGGEYRWHYDRNAVTALLYLNEVDSGELELYPNYRLRNGTSKFSFQQKCLDALLKPKVIRDFLSQKISIQPRQGMMVIMRGDRCLHSVGPLKGEQERINIVMAYDSPNAQFPVEAGLDNYLYTDQEIISQDANYMK